MPAQRRRIGRHDPLFCALFACTAAILAYFLVVSARGMGDATGAFGLALLAALIALFGAGKALVNVHRSPEQLPYLGANLIPLITVVYFLYFA